MRDTIPHAPAPSPGFDDPIGVLLACHRRMDRQLATLERLVRHLPEHHADADAQTAARATLRYFDSAAPNHHADEETSLFPRCAAAVPALGAVIRRLLNEHQQFEALWTKMRPLLVAIAVGNSAHLPTRRVAEFCALYRAHIVREERDVLAVVADALSQDVLRIVGAEMAARRGVANG